MKYLIILISKIIILFCKMFGVKERIIGKTVLKIDDSFLKKIKLPDNIIMITGSNGKTSVVRMISEVLKKSNFKVLCSSDSSLEIENILTMILDKVSLFGIVNKDILIFEIDERYVSKILKYIKPKYLVITNLYQGQMSKGGYPEFICDEINNAITQDINLILNADDSVSSMCGYNRKNVIYYGMNKDLYNNLNKKVEYMITDLDLKNGEMVINRKHTIHLTNRINYNAYNMVTTYAVTKEFGINEKKIDSILTNYDLNNYLIRNFEINGHEIVFINVKNGNYISYDQALMYITSQDEECVVLLIENEDDSKSSINDISWIWNTNFELLKSNKIKKIILSGRDAIDLAICFENSEIEMNKFTINSSNEIIKEIKEKCSCKVYVITSSYDKNII